MHYSWRNGSSVKRLIQRCTNLADEAQFSMLINLLNQYVITWKQKRLTFSELNISPFNFVDTNQANTYWCLPCGGNAVFNRYRVAKNINPLAHHCWQPRTRPKYIGISAYSY